MMSRHLSTVPDAILSSHGADLDEVASDWKLYGNSGTEKMMSDRKA